MSNLRTRICAMDNTPPTTPDGTPMEQFSALQWGFGFSTAQMRAACMAADQDAVVMALCDALQDLVAAVEYEDEAGTTSALAMANTVLAEVGGK